MWLEEPDSSRYRRKHVYNKKYADAFSEITKSNCELAYVIFEYTCFASENHTKSIINVHSADFSRQTNRP